MKLENIDEGFKEKLKNPYFKELHELEMQKLEIVKPIVGYRIEHHLTQKQLADMVGVTQQHISKIESGDFSSIQTLEKILLAIGYKVQMRVIHLKPKIANQIKQIVTAK